MKNHMKSGPLLTLFVNCLDALPHPLQGAFRKWVPPRGEPLGRGRFGGE